MRYTKNLTLVTILFVTMLACNRDSSQWIWKIDGDRVTVNELENAYDGFMNVIKVQMGGAISDEKLKEFIENPDAVGDPRMAQQFRSLQKQNFAETYKNLILMYKAAKKDGFTRREDIKQSLEILQMQFIAQLYIMDQIKEEDLKISDEQAVEYLTQIRKRYPRYRQIPMTQGIEMAKQQLSGEARMRQQQKLVSEIKDAYKIETNDKFNLSEYLTGSKKKTDSEEGASEEGSEKKDSEENKSE